MAVVLPAPAGASASCRRASRDQQLADQAPLGAVQRDPTCGRGRERRGQVAFVGPPGAGRGAPRPAAPARRATTAARGVGLGGMLPVDRLAVGRSSGVGVTGGGEQRVRVVDGDAVVSTAALTSRSTVARPGPAAGSPRGPGDGLRRAGARSARSRARRRRSPPSAARSPATHESVGRLTAAPRPSRGRTTGLTTRSPSRPRRRASPAPPAPRRARPAAAPPRRAGRAWPAGSQGWPAGQRDRLHRGRGRPKRCWKPAASTRRRPSIATARDDQRSSQRRVHAHHLADLPLPRRRGTRWNRTPAAASSASSRVL